MSASFFTETGLKRLHQRLSPVAKTLRGVFARIRRLTISAHPDAPGSSLSLWFGVIGFLCIAATSMATASILSNFMRRTWIAQDESVIRDFVQSAVAAHGGERLFTDSDPAHLSAELEMLFKLIAARDPVFLAHFYTGDGRIIWSSDSDFIGKTFNTNNELETALAGRTISETGSVEELQKSEHLLVGRQHSLFVETYVPIFANGVRQGDAPIGVVEVYRTPAHLEEAIDSSTGLIWTSTLASGLALYLTLGWIARWGDRQLARSARELAEANSLAAIGEVATAVAHGLRNPMAAMRSSAELALDRPSGESAQGALRDVVAQIDRLDHWIRSLLGCLRTETLTLESCDARALLREAESGARPRIDKAQLQAALRVADTPLPVRANRTAVNQILDCLIANALEAAPKGGTLRLSAHPSPDGRDAILEVADTGPGPDRRIDPFALFFTTKGAGLGVGLPIARRLARRHDGELTLEAAPEGGAVARLRIPLSQTDE